MTYISLSGFCGRWLVVSFVTILIKRFSLVCPRYMLIANHFTDKHSRTINFLYRDDVLSFNRYCCAFTVVPSRVDCVYFMYRTECCLRMTARHQVHSLMKLLLLLRKFISPSYHYFPQFPHHAFLKLNCNGHQKCLQNE